MTKHYPLTGDELRLRDRARREIKLCVKDDGMIRLERCQRCLVKCRTQAHHVDYSFPLWVWWLCQKCHTKADAKVRRERIRKIKEAERERKRHEDRENNCIIVNDLWVRKDSKYGQKILAERGILFRVPHPVPNG